MDQVKVYLGVAKKHHFWILAVVVVVTAVVVWAKASSSLAQKYEADKRTIEGAEKAVQGVGAGGELVNESFSKKIEGLHEDLKQRVFNAWQKLYERQEVLFKWPVKETDDGPIDLNNYKPNEPIPEYIRAFYNESVVKEEWEDLLNKVDIRRKKEAAEQTGEESSEDEGEVVKRGTEYQGLVVWKEDLRKAIIDRYYTPNAIPSTTRLWLMQEDAWLFDSLVQVVNTVNFGATDPLRAPIKQIDVLDVAQWAIDASLQSGSSIWTPNSKGNTAGGPAGMPSMPGGQAGMPNMPGGPQAAAADGAAAASADSDKEWLDGRYLDEKGQPLKSDGQQPFAEFKQMFVYMKFIMDQRRIPDLVAACANAPLQIETRQIRVQTLKDGDAGGGGGLFPPGGMGGGPMGPMAGMPTQGAKGMSPMGPPGGMGGMPMAPMAPGGMAPGGMAGGMAPPMPPGMMGGGPAMAGGMDGGLRNFEFGQEGKVETTIYDAVVELSGVIYLYQQPDISKLGTGAAGSPDKRSFGVPTTSVRVPGASASGGLSMPGGPMMSPMMAPTAK
ncbi:MAG TPA: hypothetical protein VG826_29975 [Pirellulales bacterium]|nr:hypothetical protein [Pirellulales bacterium]